MNNAARIKILQTASMAILAFVVSACGETERTVAQANANIANYTKHQKKRLEDFSIIFTSGEIIKMCVQANMIKSIFLDKYAANKRLLFLRLNVEDPETGELVRNSEAISKGLVSDEALQLTSNDCNQAIKILRPYGFFADRS